jgi:hypothetical protein
MIKTCSAHFTFAAAAIALLCASTRDAWAIGPENQLVNPTFDAVVRILYDNPGNQDAGDAYFNGTGTIIGNHNINGTGVLCVLTADHVISSTERFGGGLVSKPGIALGNSNKVSGNSPYMQALPNVMRNGPTGTSDYAVLGINYGAFDVGFNALVRNLVPTTAFFPFSDIGYGNEAKLVDQFPPAGNDGYQSQNQFGTQRFMNDKVDVISTQAANFTELGYTYTEAVTWSIDNPTDPLAIPGSGTTYGADSGSPYFSTELGHDETTGLFYFTNNQFAVHTGTFLTNNPPNSPDGYKAFGVQNYGVALTQADIIWIHQACDSIALTVPEPSSLALLILMMVVRTTRMRHRLVNSVYCSVGSALLNLS